MKSFKRLIISLTLLVPGYVVYGQVISDILYVLQNDQVSAVNPSNLQPISFPMKGAFSDIALNEQQDWFVAAGDSLFLITAGIPFLPVTDTVPDVAARHVCPCDSLLALSSIEYPYFRVYRVGNSSISPWFDLDSTRVAYTPQHIVCRGNKVYLALSDRIIVVDTDIQDTLATVRVPWAFPIYSYIAWLIPMEDNLYFDMEYATAMVRFSFLRMDYHTYSIDSLFHREGLGNWAAPLPHEIAQRIYMLNYPSYYDVPSDSLYLSSMNPFPTVIALEIDDSASHVHFAFNHTFSSLHRYDSGILTDSLVVSSAARRAELYHHPGIGPGFSEFSVDESRLDIWPNPSSGKVTISGRDVIDGLRVYGVHGALLKVPSKRSSNKSWEMDVYLLPAGIYFIKAQHRDTWSSGILIRQ